MHPDLERIVRLQGLEDAAERARRTIADEPVRQQELEAKIAAAQQALDGEKQRLAANQAARREIEKHLAEQQGRLSKYKGQLMEVKTNREYQAMQKEIETAQHEIQALEDQLLERMLEFDEVSQHVKAAEKGFADQKKAIEDERVGLASHLAEARTSLDRVAAERQALVAEIPAALVTTFERVLKHRAMSAVATVQDGRCSGCQVRMRPQTYNELRRNEALFQCESCQRFLYFTGAAPAPSAPPEPPKPHDRWTDE